MKLNSIWGADPIRKYYKTNLADVQYNLKTHRFGVTNTYLSLPLWVLLYLVMFDPPMCYSFRVVLLTKVIFFIQVVWLCVKDNYIGYYWWKWTLKHAILTIIFHLNYDSRYSRLIYFLSAKEAPKEIKLIYHLFLN